MSNTYFKDKRILITGITGFLGSHLAVELQKRGAIVYGISRKKQKGGVYAVNILQLKELSEFIKKKRIAMCFHLASQALVEGGQEDPHATLQVNIQGTLNVLEAARLNKLEKVIVTSTAHVYGENKLPYLESYAPKPTRPYETSKACIDIIAQSYADTFHLPVLIPRFVNIYGPGDMNFGRLIPKTITSILSGKSPTMWGGDVVRDYLYVDDAVSAYVHLAQFTLPDTKSNRIFNFGGGNRVTVSSVIGKLITLSKKDIHIKKIPLERRGEITRQYISSAKAKKILHWKPKMTLDKGLKKTFSWYKEYFRKTKHIL